jgi:hypothetical protein
VPLGARMGSTQMFERSARSKLREFGRGPCARRGVPRRLRRAAVQSHNTYRCTTRANPCNARSMSTSDSVAVAVIRNRDVLGGTVGGRMA